MNLETPTSDTGMGDDALAEANHRIANSLSIIAGLLRMEARRLGSSAMNQRGDARTVLGEVGTKIEAVAKLHALLSRQPRLKAVNLADHLREVSASLVSTLAAPGSFDVSLAFETSCWVPTNKVISLTLIVTELITNAIKYAHPAGVAGKIWVGGAKDPDGTLIIEVSDDGVGLPEGFDPATDGDIGLRLVRSLVQQLGASLDFTSSPLGLHARLRLPGELVASGDPPRQEVQPSKTDDSGKRRRKTPHPLQASE